MIQSAGQPVFLALTCVSTLSHDGFLFLCLAAWAPTAEGEKRKEINRVALFTCCFRRANLRLSLAHTKIVRLKKSRFWLRATRTRFASAASLRVFVPDENLSLFLSLSPSNREFPDKPPTQRRFTLLHRQARPEDTPLFQTNANSVPLSQTIVQEKRLTSCLLNSGVSLRDFAPRFFTRKHRATSPTFHDASF